MGAVLRRLVEQAVLLLLCLVLSFPHPVHTQQSGVDLSGGRVVRNGRQLQLEQTGERFVTLGTSSWDALRSIKNGDGKFKRDMDEAQRIGMTSVRVFANGEGEYSGIPSFQPQPRQYDESTFAALDQACCTDPHLFRCTS